MQKLTDWYPPEVKPVKIGWYESIPSSLIGWYESIPSDLIDLGDIAGLCRFWDSQNWCYQPARPYGSKLPPTLVTCSNQKRAWRGLAQEPKQ